MKNSEKYRSYVPYPFWAMDQEFFFKYANELKVDDRSLLSYYPFKWAYVPPHDSLSAREFLIDIGVDDGKVTAAAIAEKFENMTSLEELKQQGTVQWGGDIIYDIPPPGFRMIPEWDVEKCQLCGNCHEVCNYNAISQLGSILLVFSQLCHGVLPARSFVHLPPLSWFRKRWVN